MKKVQVRKANIFKLKNKNLIKIDTICINQIIAESELYGYRNKLTNKFQKKYGVDIVVDLITY